MTGYDLYVFLLCLIVFVLLSAMFTYFIISMTKMEIGLIGYGHRDKAIKKELNKKKKKSLVSIWIYRCFYLLLCLIFVTIFIFAVYIRTTDDRNANGIPSIKVVKSESMSKKYHGNTYLFTNDLNDQFQMYDIVICNHLPAEEDLKLYDVVVYRYEDMYVIHRIVGIEEPNEKHPNARHFTLQGDANESPDRRVVLYSQMQGIYEGTRIPYVGSFVLFLQSPAGWLCVMLVVLSVIATPIIEKKLNKAKENRVLTFTDSTTGEGNG